MLLDGSDIFGDGVNVASRLEGLADPGGICVSQTVFEHSRDKVEAAFEDIGEQALKNLPAPIRVYRVRCDERKSDEQTVQQATPPRLEQAYGSIAVFPFDSLSPDPNDVYLADGIASEIVGMLSRIPDLRVASRSAMFSSRDKDGDIWDLVHKLQFRYVLTGNVRHAGERIRVVAELTETASRTQLWSNTYERRLTDLFEVQEEIAKAIVSAFGGEYLRAEWLRVASRPTQSLDAWGLVQKARALNLPVNRDAIGQALQLSRQAIETDPTYAGAHACLASVLTQQVLSENSEDDEADRSAALASAQHAAQLSPNDTAVLRTLGKVWSLCGRHAQAVGALRRAVEIAPFDFHSWGRLARTLLYGGDDAGLEEGHAVLDRILASAPDHPIVPYWLYFKANGCAREGRYEDAVRFARRSLDIQPGYTGAWMALANALGHLGRGEEAREAVERALKANPAMTAEHLFEQIRIAAGGDDEHARKSLAGLAAAGLL